VTVCHEIVAPQGDGHYQGYHTLDIFNDDWDDDSKRGLGDKYSGAQLRDCVEILQRDGQRLSRDSADANAPRHTLTFVRVPCGSVKEAKLRLIGGSPLAVALNCFGDYRETRSGNITRAKHARSNTPDPEWHAVSITGFSDSAAEGGGSFTFINSWGNEWGTGGRGTMSFAFYEAHCYEAYAALPP